MTGVSKATNDFSEKYQHHQQTSVTVISFKFIVDNVFHGKMKFVRFLTEPTGKVSKLSSRRRWRETKKSKDN